MISEDYQSLQFFILMDIWQQCVVLLLSVVKLGEKCFEQDLKYWEQKSLNVSKFYLF